MSQKIVKPASTSIQGYNPHAIIEESASESRITTSFARFWSPTCRDEKGHEITVPVRGILLARTSTVVDGERLYHYILRLTAATVVPQQKTKIGDLVAAGSNVRVGERFELQSLASLLPIKKADGWHVNTVTIIPLELEDIGNGKSKWTFDVRHKESVSKEAEQWIAELMLNGPAQQEEREPF